ncbi:hypothetical protein GCM10027093_04380 [Paraburkholderia jirisanensis]
MSFALNGNGSGLGGSPTSIAGASGSGLSNLGTIAGLAGQLSSLTGMPGAGLIGGAARATQLAQTGMTLLGKTPANIADSINSVTGAAKPKLTQDHRFVSIDTPLGPDVLLVNTMVAEEYVSQLTEIHLDLLSHQNNIELDKIVGQLVTITLDPQGANASLTQIVASSAKGGKRYFHGYVVSFGRVGNSGTVTEK